MIEAGLSFRGCVEGIGTRRVRVTSRRITQSVLVGCVATHENILEKPPFRRRSSAKPGLSFWKICVWNLKMTKPDYVRAHRHSFRNRNELLLSRRCGCFYCGAIFSPAEVKEWVDEEEGKTALCPRCGIDAVIGANSDYPINADFLGLMAKHWFQRTQVAKQTKQTRQTRQTK